MVSLKKSFKSTYYGMRFLSDPAMSFIKYCFSVEDWCSSFKTFQSWMRNSECFTLTYLASLLPKAVNVMKYTGQEVCSKMYHSSHHCDLKLQFSRAGEGLITLSHEPSSKAVADLRWKLLKDDLIQMKRMISPIKRHCSISPNIINISCQIRMHFPGTLFPPTRCYYVKIRGEEHP